jgi:hypothetical protein
MSVPANQEKDPLWHAAVLAISEARDQIGKDFVWALERGSEEGTAFQPSQRQVGDPRQDIAQPNENCSAREETPSEHLRITGVRKRRVVKTITGLTMLAAAWTVALDWQPSRDQGVPGLLSTSSAPKTSQLSPTSNGKSIKADLEVRQSPPPVPSTVEGTALTSPASGATAASVDVLLRQIARLEEALDQLRNRQSGLDREREDLAEQLKAMRNQTARDNAAMADQLKEFEAQSRDNATMAEQLKVLRWEVELNNAAITEQLRAGKDQAEKVGAKTTEQRPKPKPLRPPATRPVTAPPQAAARPPTPRVRQGTN